MNTVETATYEQLMAQIPAERKENAEQYMTPRPLAQVNNEIPPLQRYGKCALAVVEPSTPYVDEDLTLGLLLEYQQGLTPAHYLRAKQLQLYVAPHSRVVILPNNSADSSPVDTLTSLTPKQLEAMAHGDIRPYAELLMDTVERADKVHKFGELALVGSSMGGLTALGMIAAGSEKTRVGSAVVIEVPSELGRSAKKLTKDFNKSTGGVFGLHKAVKESGIPAQAEAMRPDRMLWDVIKFGVRSVASREARLIKAAMAGSANDLFLDAVEQLGPDRIAEYHIEGSRIFDDQSLCRRVQDAIAQTRVEGPMTHAHPTPNNLPLNAAMVYNGFSKIV